MKTASKLIIFIVTSLVLVASACAQSPREQLQQMVQQLQTTPNDNVLRERIIKLATNIKPAPEIPEEATRAFVKGNVFQKEAKDASGYELAISAYRDALRIAPWWGDAYFNLSVALESSSKFNEAIASIKLFIASVPSGSKEAREAQNRVYALEAKGEMATKQSAIAEQTRVAAERERQRPSTEGEWVESRSHIHVIRKGNSFTITPGSGGMLGGAWRPIDIEVNQQRVKFGVQQPSCPQCGITRYDVSLSASGNELTGTFYGANGSYPSTWTRKP